MTNNKSNIDLSSLKKILIIQLGPIGDAFLTTSYFATLKKAMPNVELHYLIFKKYLKAIYNNPMIDKTICIESKKGFEYYAERIRIINMVRRENYDLVIDQQNKQSTQLITLLSNSKYRLGYEDGSFSFAYNLKAKRGERRYSASKKFDILGPLGIKQEKYELYFHISDKAKSKIHIWLNKNGLEEQKFICISPGSPVKKKKWRLEYFDELAKIINKKYGTKFVIVWAPNELNDAKKLQKLIGDNSILACPTTLDEVCYLISKAKLLICNDGGLNHLAVAARVKTLAIFGRTNPIDWSPAQDFKTHHHVYNNFIPDTEKGDDFGLTPKEVFTKVEEILDIDE